MASALVTRLDQLVSSNFKGQQFYDGFTSILTELNSLENAFTIDTLTELHCLLSASLGKINNVIKLDHSLKRALFRINNENLITACDWHPIEKSYTTWFSKVFKLFYETSQAIYLTFDTSVLVIIF